MKKVQKITLSLLVALGLVSFSVVPAQAIDVWDACSGKSDSKVCQASDKDEASDLVTNIISALLWALGAVAVIVIVIGGFKYVTSNGDANKIQSAKNVILYAVVGLVVAMLAQAIVIFVVKAV